MRNRFEEQLGMLHVEMIRMGALCEDAISYASQTLVGGLNMQEQVYKTEREIDQKERDIESLCMRLLLQQQPVATDLRMVSSALRMISDMERIGDQTADIAEICGFLKELQTGQELESQVHIRGMAEAASRMVTMSVDSFVKKDLKLAQDVIHYDDVVDELFNKVKGELVELLGRGDRSMDESEFCIDMLMIAKYFERIGDHAVNIAEWVEFSITGVHAG